MQHFSICVFKHVILSLGFFFFNLRVCVYVKCLFITYFCPRRYIKALHMHFLIKFSKRLLKVSTLLKFHSADGETEALRGEVALPWLA